MTITQVVGFGFLVTKLMRSKGVPLRDSVPAHRNAYYLRTKPLNPKGQAAIPTKKKKTKKKVTEEERSSNISLAEVVKKAMTKRKLVLEGESQPSKVSKVPKAPLPKKSKGKAVELSKRMVIEKPTEQSQPEGELTIQMV
nr:uncharacterized protein LOC109167327 [Ipomoea batatas]